MMDNGQRNDQELQAMQQEMFARHEAEDKQFFEENQLS